MALYDLFVDDAQDAASDVASQVAALCWRIRKGQVKVLLITSRDTGRWVIPKGWPIAGMTTAAAAAREAWEEAGVEGRVEETTLGAFGYDKLARMDVSVRCSVAVHALRVRTLKSRFPEAGQRRRVWFTALAAADLVAEPGLQSLLRHVDQNPGMLRKQG
ncbi:MAG: NUDIX hydrolase [Candidatus Saccharibacteria bacterium]|nr:NUDIX hydrolase [Pseudorhodobacter sp.]